MNRKENLPKLQSTASFEPKSLNDDSRTVEVNFSSGYTGKRNTPFGQFYEQLSMDPSHVNMNRLKSGNAPLLANHDSSDLTNVIGVVESANIENGVGKAKVRFAKDPKSDAVYQRVKDGILKNVSIGYTINKMQDVSKKGDSIPTYKATDYEIHEISIVPSGFDPNATVRSAEDNNSKQETLYPVEILTTERDQKMNSKEQEVQKSEKNRIQAINRAVRAANLEASVAEDMIERDLTVEQASSEVFAKLEEKSKSRTTQSPRVLDAYVSSDNEDLRRDALTESWAKRINRNYTSQNPATSLFDGRNTLRSLEEYVGRRLGESDLNFAKRAMTTSDLPNILANVAEKSLRQDYLAQTPSYKPWTKSNTVRNFKTANRLMLGDFPSLATVDEHGEVTMGAVSEQLSQVKVVRYLKGIEFTKEMIVNDDLGALSDFSTKSARAATRLDSNLVYTQCLLANPTMNDSIALFHASHGNLAGSGTDITLAAVAAGVQAMRNQKSIDQVDYIDISPKFLICGPAKEFVARQLVSTDLLATQFSAVNPYAGALNVVIDPRITGTDWYLAADPANIDTIELNRLASEEGPQVVTQLGRGAPGAFSIIVDYSVGVAAIDYRGLYKNPGA